MTVEHRRGLLFAALTAFTWSILAIAVKVALQSASSETIVFYRFAFASIGLASYFLIASPKSFKILFSPPILAIACGVCLSINYIGFMKAIDLTSPSNAQVLIQIAPMLLIFSGIIFFKERPSLRQYSGFLLAFLGFSLFFRDQLALALSKRHLYLEGNLWVLLAAVTWACYGTFQKMLTRKWQPQEINLLIYVLSTAITLPLADFSVIVSWETSTWLLMSFLGINTLIAYGSLGIALKHAPASQVSIIITLNPLLTLLFMKILEKMAVTWIKPEQISHIGYLGAFLVVAGAITVVYRRSQPLASKPSLN